MRDVQVNFLQVESVEIKNLPADQTYVKGHDKNLRLDGAVVLVTMNDGTTREMELTEDMCDFSFKSLGEQEVVVSVEVGNFGIFKTNFVINVIRTLDQIAVTAPTKLEYFPGDALDLTGSKLALIYSDGMVENIALT